MSFEISIGSTVQIKSKNTKHTVLELNDNKPSALITMGSDHCWWPINELLVINDNQLDLFG